MGTAHEQVRHDVFGRRHRKDGGRRHVVRRQRNNRPREGGVLCCGMVDMPADRAVRKTRCNLGHSDRLAQLDTKSFDDVADEIRSSLTQSERDRLFDEWLVDRIREAKIVVNPKYGRFDRLAQRPAVVPSSSELRE